MLGRRARLLSAFVLVLACAGLFAWAASGALLRRLAASAASVSLGTPVTIEAAALGVFPPRLSLERIRVANPPGYDDEPILAVERLSVRIAPLALLRRTLRVPEVSVNGFSLNLERSRGRTNLEALRDRVQAVAASQTAASRRVVITLLAVRGGRVTTRVLFGRRVSVPVKDLELHGVGEQQGGLAPAQLLQLLLRLMDPSLKNAFSNVDLGGAAKGLLP